MSNLILSNDLFLLSFVIAFLYLVVSLNLFLCKATEIKILELIVYSKNSPRNRSHLTEKIVHARQSKRRALLWPISLIKHMLFYVKKKTKKN